MTQEKKIQRVLSGKVVSDKMDKTIVVSVDRTKRHPLYGKRFTVSKKYHVHDPENKFIEGETVAFKEVRPLSKTKRWAVIYK